MGSESHPWDDPIEDSRYGSAIQNGFVEHEAPTKLANVVVRLQSTPHSSIFIEIAKTEFSPHPDIQTTPTMRPLKVFLLWIARLYSRLATPLAT